MRLEVDEKCARKAVELIFAFNPLGQGESTLPEDKVVGTRAKLVKADD